MKPAFLSPLPEPIAGLDCQDQPGFGARASLPSGFKTKQAWLILLLTLTLFPRQASPAVLGAIATAEATILERGPNYKVIRTVSGGQFIEIADGISFQNQDGIWTDAQEIVELIDGGKGGAIARQTQHQVIFSPNINNPTGTVD